MNGYLEEATAELRKARTAAGRRSGDGGQVSIRSIAAAGERWGIKPVCPKCGADGYHIPGCPNGRA